MARSRGMSTSEKSSGRGVAIAARALPPVLGRMARRAAAGALVLGMAVGTGHAQSGWRDTLAALDGLECQARSYAPDPERLIAALSAWALSDVEAIARAAGFSDFSDYVIANGGLTRLSPERRDQVTAALWAAVPGLPQDIAADVAASGTRLCPVIAAIWEDSLPDLLERQAGFRSFHHGSIRYAQRLAHLHECGTLDVDGALGPRTQEVLGALLSGAPPLPGTIAEIAARPVARGICATDAASGPALGAADFLPTGVGMPASWLVALTPARAAAFDAIGRLETPPVYHQRLLLSAVSGLAEQHWPPTDPAAYLARIYGHGMGIAPNPRAAAFWRAGAQPSAYDRYRAVNGPDAAADVARELIAQLDAFDYVDTPPPGLFWSESMGFWGADPFAVRGDRDAWPIRYAGAPMSVAHLADIARLARLMQAHEAARDTVLERAPPDLLVWLAHRLLESAADDGARDTALAALLLHRAAESGHETAMSRLALMALHGLGQPADRNVALEWARRADALGEPFAAMLRARLAEDAGGMPLDDLVDLYLRAVVRETQVWAPNVPMLANRLTDPASPLATPEGHAALHARLRTMPAPGLALAIADAALCVACGVPVDVSVAADWLRLADDLSQDAAAQGAGPGPEAALRLAALLALHPETGTPDEAAARLARWAETETTTPAHVVADAALRLGAARPEQALDEICAAPDGASPEFFGDPCEIAAQAMASGRLGMDAIAPGLARLTARDSVQLLDLLAAYGDFEGALAAGERILARRAADPFPRPLLDGLGTRRDAVLRRLFSGRGTADMDGLPTALPDYLRFMARQGDVAAAGYLRLVADEADGAPPPASPPSPVPPDIATAQAAYAAQVARGGLGGALVRAARDLSQAHFVAGNAAEALGFESVALRAELDLAAIGNLGEGPLETRLSQVCVLSKSSERVFDIGAEDAALALAKDAVNRLQALRADLSALPENLQACFRDLVSDHYRWMADLLIRQNRLPEAEFVIGLLKDFEAFEFVGRDDEFAARSFETLPMTAEEAGFIDRIATLPLPLGPAARRSEALRAKRAAEGLTPEETAELAALDAQLDAADAAFDAALDDLERVALDLGRADALRVLDAVAPLQGYLQFDVEQPAAALHYVVLPDRLSIILTTPDIRLGHVVTEWDGAPFSEDRLNAAIAAFHDAVSTPDADPRPAARRLHALLLAPLWPAIADAGAELLLVSQDRRLRYLPFAALHDGSEFVVQQVEIATLSDAGFEIAARREDGRAIAALGMSMAAPGFAALPGVELELSGLVRSDDVQGLYDGRTWLNDDFDTIALEDALRIGGRDLGIVHIASHFHLGASEADSFLLLGTGGGLDLASLKNNRRAYDFSGVELLTLSACSTGFADIARDGRELESLSAITGRRGARSVMASLWPVADTATAILMQRFYELRARGGYTKAAALALVQREFVTGTIGSQENLPGESLALASADRGGVSLLRPRPGHDLGIGHPYYWAPFVLTGNWR
jgi:CHAT domain-containing protein/TPR repeat protein